MAQEVGPIHLGHGTDTSHNGTGELEEISGRPLEWLGTGSERRNCSGRRRHGILLLEVCHYRPDILLRFLIRNHALDDAVQPHAVSFGEISSHTSVSSPE
jgi:hypothetical protein